MHWRGAGWASAYLCVFGLVSLCHCVSNSVSRSVSLYGPPAYLAGVRVNVSVTVPVYYDFESGRVAEIWQKMSISWVIIKQNENESEVNKIVK